MRTPDGEEAPIPGSPAVGMAGGSLAVLDTASGRLWVTREDPSLGLPSVGPLYDQAEPVAAVGEDAALAVGLDGTVYAVSAAEDRLLTVSPAGETGFAEPKTDPLPDPSFSDALSVTAVGARPSCSTPRTADCRSSGAETEVPEGAVLQQPGPSASAVLVGAREALLSVDLASGGVTTVAGGAAASLPGRFAWVVAATAPGPEGGCRGDGVR